MRQVAAQARSENLLPPLVRLRIDRSAAAFLRAHVSNWTESGFDGTLEDHRIRALEEPDDYVVESWVRSVGVGGEGARRTFRMHLEVRDGPLADRLVSFEWIR